MSRHGNEMRTCALRKTLWRSSKSDCEDVFKVLLVSYVCIAALFPALHNKYRNKEGRNGFHDQFVTNLHGEVAGKRQSPCAGMRLLTECYVGFRTDNSRK